MLEFYILVITLCLLVAYFIVSFFVDFFKFKNVKTKCPPLLPLTFIAYLFTMFREESKFSQANQ